MSRESFQKGLTVSIRAFCSLTHVQRGTEPAALHALRWLVRTLVAAGLHLRLILQARLFLSACRLSRSSRWWQEGRTTGTCSLRSSSRRSHSSCSRSMCLHSSKPWAPGEGEQPVPSLGELVGHFRSMKGHLMFREHTQGFPATRHAMQYDHADIATEQKEVPALLAVLFCGRAMGAGCFWLS